MAAPWSSHFSRHGNYDVVMEPAADDNSRRPFGALPAWAAAGIAGHLLIWQISEPPLLFSDFYKAYYPAAKALTSADWQSAWQGLEPGVGGFVNLPIVAWLFVPFLIFGKAGAGWAFLAFGMAAVLASWLIVVRGLVNATLAGPMLFLFLVNGPMVNSLREGNTTHIAFAAVICGLALWKGGRNFLAGLLLGVAAIIKIPFLLLGVYFLLRRNWPVVGGGLAAIGAAAVLSLGVHGLAANSAWYDNSIAPYLGRAIAAFNVQSVDGFLIRLGSGAEGLFDWTARDISPLHKAARLVLFAAAGLAFLWTTRCFETRTSPFDKRDYLEFSLVLALAIVLSPVSWTHYYLFFVLPFGLYLAGNFSTETDMTTRRLMWSGFVLTALPVILMPIDSDMVLDVWSRSGVSSYFLGGVLMLIALLRARWRAEP